jgi:chorismate mutase
VEAALKHGADMVWIGARTTVNPFNVQEIADAVAGSGVKVFVKNPLNPDTALWSGAVERVLRAGVPRGDVGLIHRGFSQVGAGDYRNPPLWHLAVDMRQRYPDLVMLCDPSHISGKREYVPDVAQKAADLFFDGLIVESHCNPAAALSDASQQLTPADLKTMLDGIAWRTPDTANPSFTEVLTSCRAEIDEIDAEIFGLLSRRMAIAERIGGIKRDNSVTILQEQRWRKVVEGMVARAEKLNLSPEFIRAILDAIHFESIAHQNKLAIDN